VDYASSALARREECTASSTPIQRTKGLGGNWQIWRRMQQNFDSGFIRERRVAHGLTQSEVASRLGVSQATISLWENGNSIPDSSQWVALSNLLQMNGAPGSLDISAQANAEDVEGLDATQSSGWGEYPLDSVFVRTDQRTVTEVVKRINASRYDLNPEFQRDFVWPVDKQSRLIESCIMRIPLPVLYVAEAPDGRIIVVDGLQRLTTFKRFLGNEFKLTFPESEDSKPHPLQGVDYKHLDLKLQERVEDTQLTLYILDSKAPERAKLDIFDRVNSGEPLSRQQMRNCLYNGPATLWLKDRVSSPLFLKATGNSLASKRMRDREAINRFCAFSILGWKAYRSGEMDRFLADVLEAMNKMCEADLDALTVAFDQAMAFNFELFGRHAFRKSLSYDEGANRSVLNIALFDVCSVVLPRLLDRAGAPHKLQSIRNAIIDILVNDSDFVHAITYSTNSRKQVEKRFSILEHLVNEVAL
jgi:transcriptional regulator with XRE-family HTH domain